MWTGKPIDKRQVLTSATDAMITAGSISSIGILCMLFAMPAAAQSVRDTIAGARLGPGYAQMLNLAATPDLSAAHYDLRDGSGLSIDITRLPYEARWRALSKDADLYWRVAGGYLQMQQDVPATAGSVSSKWYAYSLSGACSPEFGSAMDSRSCPPSMWAWLGSKIGQTMRDQRPLCDRFWTDCCSTGTPTHGW